MRYFEEVIKFDPVNHYLVLTREELINLKQNISQEEISNLKSKVAYFKVLPFYTVVDKPKELCLGINPHNYISLATYHWPNPDTDNHLPYIKKDGYSNPEGEKFDKDRLRQTAFICYYELILYYLTDDKDYYNDVKKRINIFFIDKKTRMYPNMNHAQMIKGVNLGRGIGIIDFAANFTYTLVLLQSLSELNYIEEDFYANYKKLWLKPFLSWLESSDIALQERDSKNNHGTMYDFLILVLYDIFGYKKKTKMLVYSFINLRMIPQIKEDGSMPLELARTKSKSYSLMGLKGIFDFAKIAGKSEYNLWYLDWYYRKIDNLIEIGMNFLIERLLINPLLWTWEQVTIFDKTTLLPLVYEAKKRYNIDKLELALTSENLDDLLPIIIKNLA